MPDPNPYQVLGPSVPAMLGRAALMGRIDNHLQKPSPDHVSVVGPAHYGKSVLLKHLAASYGAGADGYAAAAYVDLRHPVPTSDLDFMQRFATEIKTVLQAAGSQLADSLEGPEGHEYLDLVFRELEGEGGRLLAVLDGFDYALAASGLTDNLWDQLRTLAQRNSLRLVTGSRRPLRELCRTEESMTSDFWGIFYYEPLRVAAFNDDDLEALLLPFRDAHYEFDGPVREELANWTGGVPLLTCALLLKLWVEYHGTISRPVVEQAAIAMLAEQRGLLDELWDHCSDELRADLGTLSCGNIPLADLSVARQRALEETRIRRSVGESPAQFLLPDAALRIGSGASDCRPDPPAGHRGRLRDPRSIGAGVALKASLCGSCR